MTRTITLMPVVMDLDARHGGAYDRGSADAYYERPFDPHYFVNGTHTSPRVPVAQMTPDEILQYTVGYLETRPLSTQILETRHDFDAE